MTKRLFVSAALILACLALSLDVRARAAAATEPPACVHVATADTIRIYYCEDIQLFVNQFGFMVFEP